MNHRSANRYAAQSATNSTARSEGNSRRKRNSESAGGVALAFQEDFNLEHSRNGLTISVFAQSNSPDPHKPDVPSCVYLG